MRAHNSDSARRYNRGGAPFRVVEPGYAIKMFPSQYGTHFAITAALDLHGRMADPAAIESVEVVTPRMIYIDRPRPASSSGSM